ncbi:cupin domain-containing protein [Phyllobacterium lublinensis]|uniref:cupin domain-containing protein n=1 Tax=Phyllobacterium lublinensis TaxID=2875708 RepID=UPI001CCB918C|nr:cupin domain-containing protein [Phyllobacterium sp. 2063]MBZ9656394.1 cupin domain-containing protein [Phyllobacterium sp. 2063]
MTLTAHEIRQHLGLEPHPEGGSYVQTFRDNQSEWPEGGRGHSTAIYFLLERGEVSAWHRVKDAAEVWHWYGGAPLRLIIAPEGLPRETHQLGLDLAAGERPQAIVPAGQWQTATTLGDWTLVGCTVAPGFDFAQFELAEPGWEP